jgi:polar amino acid transport system permease protein
MVLPINNFGWAVISFSFFAGAFNVEIFRAGIEAVPTAMVDAAESLGYSRLKAYVSVVLPLAFRISLPALGNNLVNLVKTTTLAYAIAVPELLYVSAQIWSEEANVREMMYLLLFLYLCIIQVMIFVMDRLERRLRIPGYSV